MARNVLEIMRFLFFSLIHQTSSITQVFFFVRCLDFLLIILDSIEPIKNFEEIEIFKRLLLNKLSPKIRNIYYDGNKFMLRQSAWRFFIFYSLLLKKAATTKANNSCWILESDLHTTLALEQFS